MLVDEQTLERIKSKGVNFNELVTIARQNQATVEPYQAKDSSKEEFIDQLLKTTATSDMFVIASYSRTKLNQVITTSKKSPS